MSKQTALSFISKVNVDPAMQKQIKEIEDVEGLLRFAETAGYSFTGSEWNETVADLAQSACGELADEKLSQVTGGGAQALQSFEWSAKFLPPRVVAKVISV